MNHVDWKESHNLGEGPRWVKNLPMHIEKRIAALKECLVETPTHVYSGALYGDLKSLVTEKWQDRKWHQKNQRVIVDQKWEYLPSGKTVISGMFTKFYGGHYHLFSSNPHFTRCTGMTRYALLFSSSHFIEVKVLEKGNPEYLGYGLIREIVE
jgi:hypothetical protein